MNAVARDHLLARERLIDVARLGLDRDGVDHGLQDLVDTAAGLADTPFGLTTALLDDAQAFTAVHGPLPDWLAEACGTPIEWSFCSAMLADRAPLVVTDVAADPRFTGNPLVTVGGVRAYAGVPLISTRGHVVGGLCVLDVQPRDFPPDLPAMLRELAAEAITRLEQAADS